MRSFLLPFLLLIGSSSAFVVPSRTRTRTTHTNPMHNRPNRPNKSTGAVLSSSPSVASRTSSVALEMAASTAAKIALTALTTGLATSIRIVRQGNAAILERFGKYQRTMEPGLHLIIPLVDRIAKNVSQREQVFDIPPQKCITLDNAPLLADAVVYWRVFDPIKAFYSVEDLNLAIQNLVLTQLRSEIGKISLDDTFSAREQINSILLKDLDVETKAWGIKIIRVEVRDIIPNREIMNAMEMQMAAERTKRAVVIKSEGEKLKAIAEAEGEAQSLLIDAKAEAESTLVKAEAEAKKLELEAEGAAKAIGALVKTLKDPSEAAKFKLAQQYIETQSELATSENTKVILSNSDGSSDALVKALSIYSD